MTALAAGSNAAITHAAGASLTISGLGTYQLMPPGTNGNFSPKVWHQVGAQPQVLGPLGAATVVNLAAAAGGPGLKYALSSSNPSLDTITQEIVTVSRSLTQADNGTVIPVANGVTLTAAAGTLTAFSCIVLPMSGATASLAFSGGATGNGAATTITRTRAANLSGFAVIQDPSAAADAFAVGGA